MKKFTKPRTKKANARRYLRAVRAHGNLTLEQELAEIRARAHAAAFLPVA